MKIGRPTASVWLAMAAVMLCLVGGASAASKSANAVPLPTAAGAARYLTSLGLNPAGFVVQRGARNYAGAKCPGKGWNCTTAKRVLQIATGGGVNSVSCSGSGGSASSSASSGSVSCTIVQNSTSAANTATCTEQSSGDIAALTQTCSITQTSASGKNTATVVQGFQQGPSSCSPPSSDTSNQTQSGTQTATVIQTSTSGPIAANVNQTVSQCVAARTAASVAQNQATSQTFTIRQGPPGFSPGMTTDCSPDTGTIDASATQSQHQRGYASSTATGTQNQNADLFGHVDQCSAGLAEYTASQNEDQFLAQSPGVTQTQVGPAVLTGKAGPHGKRTLLRGVCCSFQGTNIKDHCTITQMTSQVANGNADQTENLSASAGTTGNCTGNVQATENSMTSTASGQGSNLNTGLECQSTVCTGTQVPTKLVWSPVPSGTYHDPVTLTATLTRTDTNAGVSGQTVQLAAGNEGCTATTTSSGVASCDPTVVTDTPGNYPATATFATTPSFLGSSDTETFSVAKQPTTLVFTGNTSADFDDPANLQVTLYEGTGNPVDPSTAGNVSFTLGTQQCPAPVPVAGTTASCTISPVTQPSGPVAETASFDAAGNAYYLPSSATTSFQIMPEESVVTYTGPSSADYSDPVTLKGTLTEDGVLPLANKTLTFTLGALGQQCTGVTNASGVASCTLIVNQAASSSAGVTVSFGGDLYYATSTSAAPFAITQEENSLSYTGPTSAKKSSTVTLSGKLLHGSTPLPGRTLTFKIGGQTCSAPTGSSGSASCNITLSQPAGGYTVTVTFGGDQYYQANSVSRSFTIKS